MTDLRKNLQKDPLVSIIAIIRIPIRIFVSFVTIDEYCERRKNNEVVQMLDIDQRSNMLWEPGEFLLNKKEGGFAYILEGFKGLYEDVKLRNNKSEDIPPLRQPSILINIFT